MKSANKTKPGLGAKAPTSDAERPPIEIELRKVAAGSVARARRTYEIWTKNRVYALDSSLSCVDVIDLASGRSNKRHACLGAKLVGGQLRGAGKSELTLPLPTPGGEAVFQRTDEKGRVQLALTSKVTRVILFVYRVNVGGEDTSGAWDQITQT